VRPEIEPSAMVSDHLQRIDPVAQYVSSACPAPSMPQSLNSETLGVRWEVFLRRAVQAYRVRPNPAIRTNPKSIKGIISWPRINELNSMADCYLNSGWRDLLGDRLVVRILFEHPVSELFFSLTKKGGNIIGFGENYISGRVMVGVIWKQLPSTNMAQINRKYSSTAPSPNLHYCIYFFRYIYAWRKARCFS